MSNFGVAQLEGLQAAGCEMPEVNQIELHCWNQQRGTVDFCRRHGIAIMSYCPLARCKLLGQTALSALAEETGQAEARLALRWLLQKGFVTIPKSVDAGRIASNAVFDFELTPSQMAVIDGLDQGFKASNASKSMDLPWQEVM